jgi:UDP-N-acetylmuramoyl-tripeptide--D-alanyl-D-alanine ligase
LAPQEDCFIANVATDSREIGEGGLFFAMRGEAMDGHRFIHRHDARRQPCRGRASRRRAPCAGGGQLRRASRPWALPPARVLPEARIIGVTGSVGKTSVKEAIYAALDRTSRGGAHRSVKSYNNHVGVPLSLARMPARTLLACSRWG